MKVGDRLLCKKAYPGSSLKNSKIGDVVFNVGCYYYVKRVFNNIGVDIKTGCGNIIVGFYFDDICADLAIKNGYVMSECRLLGDYFYTEQELRKLKLDKIKEHESIL